MCDTDVCFDMNFVQLVIAWYVTEAVYYDVVGPYGLCDVYMRILGRGGIFWEESMPSTSLSSSWMLLTKSIASRMSASSVRWAFSFAFFVALAAVLLASGTLLLPLSDLFGLGVTSSFILSLRSFLSFPVIV